MNTKSRITTSCKGFTLQKSILVLAITALLVIAVMLLLDFMERSRVGTAIDDINRTTAAVFAYQDRYGRTPGDDGPVATLAARGGGWAGVTAGNANGSLDVGSNQVFVGSGESVPFWQQLKAAGFISGSPTTSGQMALPTNPWGGLVSVLGDNTSGDLDGNKVCLSQVPGVAALSIDTELDDGSGGSGRLRATLGSPGANTNPSNVAMSGPYSSDDIYTICFRMGD